MQGTTFAKIEERLLLCHYAMVHVLHSTLYGNLVVGLLGFRKTLPGTLGKTYSCRQ
jgi:hypothetical protein